MLGITRRRAVQAAVTGGIIGSLSGCLGSDGGSPDYSQVTPDPDELGSQKHYPLAVFDPSAIVQAKDNLDPAVFDNLESFETRFQETGVRFGETNSIISFSGSTMISGSFDNKEVANELDEENFDEDKSENGYTYFIQENENDQIINCAAVGEYTIISGPVGDADPRTAAESIVGAANGNAGRYSNEYSAFSSLTDTIGSPTFGRLQTFDPVTVDNPEGGSFENCIGSATGISINGETSEFTFARSFKKSGDVDSDDIKDYVSGNAIDDLLDDISYSANGSVGSFSGNIDTDKQELLSLSLLI